MDQVVEMYEKLLRRGLNPEEIAEIIEKVMPGCGEDVLGTLVEMAEEEEGCDG